ncbi:MAG TPA: hypothetical protein VGR29_11150 [Thermomicrobiales bacterium]|nr:hypothetical protein [Thermomicrobiales bacterium]
MRRLFFGFLAAILLLPMSMVSVLAAQDATPESAFSDLGLPTLDITATADAYEGIPDSIEAGRYLVTVTALEEAGQFGAGVAFIQPAGVTGDEFISMLGEVSGPPDESGVGAAAATPIEGGAATPAEGTEEMGGPPDVFYQSLYAGGTFALPGETSQVVLDLTPGEWVAWGDDPGSPQAPVAFEVTGEMPAELPEPESAATLTMGEYVIEVTEGEITSGQQVLRIDNIGAQPHFIAAGTTQLDVTGADIEAVLEAEMTGTPAAVDFNPDEDLEEAFYSGTQSMGTSQWIVADIQPGTLIMICFFPDIEDGMPHAFYGMYTIVEVAE